MKFTNFFKKIFALISTRKKDVKKETVEFVDCDDCGNCPTCRKLGFVKHNGNDKDVY